MARRRGCADPEPSDFLLDTNVVVAGVFTGSSPSPVALILDAMKPYQVRNWPAYETALRNRGELTLWFSEKAISIR